MKNIKIKNKRREQRRQRNRAKIFGTAEKPRLSLFRSNKFIHAQLIDDEQGKTLISATTKGLKKAPKTAQAKLLGEAVAEKALKAGIKQAIFNKGSYSYHGRIKAVADGAREKGLKL